MRTTAAPVKRIEIVKKPTVLLIDDEESIRKSLGGSLEDEGYALVTAQDGASALDIIKTQPVDIVFLDIWLPGMDGLETLKAIKDYNPLLEVIIMTGHGTVNTAVQAIKMGAFEFLEKPFSLDTIIEIIRKVQEKRQITLQTMRYSKSIRPDNRDVLVGESQVIAHVREMLSQFDSTDDNVLIQGESGTGKELVARLIHYASRHTYRPLIKFNCVDFNQDEIERELFGYHDDTHPALNKDGILNTTSGGALFISAIDVLQSAIQKRLAQHLKASGQQHQRLRVFASSIKDLREELKQRQMSEELFSCFNPEIICMPPLRKRGGDIALLLRHFLTYYCEEHGQKDKMIEDEALEILTQYDWPGNVKELKNMVEKIVVSMPTTSITVNDIPRSVRSDRESGIEKYYVRYNSLNEAEDAWKKDYILYHLRRNNRNIAETAKYLQIDEVTLLDYIKRYGIVLVSGKKAYHHAQRTLKRSMVLSGRGLHSGIKTGLIISPLPPNSGILFGNISDGETIPAHVDFIESTEYATSLKKGTSRASTIEHFLAVLHAYRITNLLIKINNEVPIMDGSAVDFCQLIEDAEIEEQDATIEEIVISERYTVGEVDSDKKYMIIEPSERFIIHYTLNYPRPVGRQEYTFMLDNEQAFKQEIAPARTFGFLKDIEALEKKGLASGGRLNNFILIDDEKIINTELRFPDEFVRHKILDLMGDLYLLGRPIRGKITANMTGHTHNCSMLRLLRENIQIN